MRRTTTTKRLLARATAVLLLAVLMPIAAWATRCDYLWLLFND